MSALRALHPAPIRLIPTVLWLGLLWAALCGPLQASERSGRGHRSHAASTPYAQDAQDAPDAPDAPDMPGAVSEAYRCKAASGRVVYSQWPCDGGQHLNELADPRTRAQQRAGADQIERDQALSRRMAADRLRLHRQAQGQTVISVGPPARAHGQAQTRQQAKAGKVADPHAPVPIERCKPPRCFTAKSPKEKKAES
jgi:hypothetical protein